MQVTWQQHGDSITGNMTTCAQQDLKARLDFAAVHDSN